MRISKVQRNVFVDYVCSSFLSFLCVLVHLSLCLVIASPPNAALLLHFAIFFSHFTAETVSIAASLKSRKMKFSS